MTLILHASTTRHTEWGGLKRYIRIFVYDFTQELQRAGNIYRPGNWSDVGGSFHPAPYRERYIEQGMWVSVTSPHWAGVMRLSLDCLNSEVVVHECVHAGAAIYRMDVKSNIILGYECRPREETLAYIIGDLAASVSNALHLAKVW